MNVETATPSEEETVGYFLFSCIAFTGQIELNFNRI